MYCFESYIFIISIDSANHKWPSVLLLIIEYELYQILSAQVLRLFGHTSSPTTEQAVVRMNELIGL